MQLTTYNMKTIRTKISKMAALVGLICLSLPLWAQVPQQLNYQGAVRNAAGEPLSNTPIAVRLSIQESGANPVVHYTEERLVSTNKLGLYSVLIAGPNALKSTGDFTQIPWGAGAKALKVEIDINGGSNFSLAGITPLVSVPYALYAKYAENGPAGPPGPQGPQGPQGEIGYSGGNGVPGAPGTPGIDASIDMYVDNNTGIIYVRDPNNPDNWLPLTGDQGPVGPAGSSGVSVTGAIIDSQGHLILTLSDNTTIDAGIAIGQPGPIGPMGPQGVQGNPGPQGVQGDPGPAGPAGPMGPQGIQGDPGPAGPAGAQGPAGPAGVDGLTTLSITTSEPIGSNCINGGLKIETGLDLNFNGGLDDNEITLTRFVCNGLDGAVGPAGPSGVTITGVYVNESGHLILFLSNNSTLDAGFVIGPQGPAGIQGPIGPAGVNGSDGLSVVEGKVGANGHLILTMSDNTTIDVGIVVGPTGPQGPAGPEGPQGPAGPSGITALQDSHIFVGDVNNLPVEVLMKGDATISNTGVLTITDNAVTLSKMADGPPDQVYVTNSAGEPMFTSMNNLGWSLTGNSGTSDGFHFLGTTDMAPLLFKVDNEKVGRIDKSTGETSLGYLAGNSSTNLSLQNTLIGNQAGQLLASGSNRNTFVGAFAGRNVSFNSGLNTAVGESALSSLNIAGSFNNVALGSLAGMQFTGGNNNIFIGKNAGLSASGTANGNILIGLSTVASPGLTNASAIGNNAVVTASNSIVLGGTGANSVNVGIGTSAPDQKLEISEGNFKVNEGIFMSTQSSAMAISTPIPSGIVGASQGAVPMTNVKGQIVVDGTNNTASYTMVLISYSNPTPYTANPSVMITPANATAADADYYVNSSVNGFSIFYKNKTIGLRDAAFNYWVIQ